jgi:hypothetical protein
MSAIEGKPDGRRTRPDPPHPDPERPLIDGRARLIAEQNFTEFPLKFSD